MPSRVQNFAVAPVPAKAIDCTAGRLPWPRPVVSSSRQIIVVLVHENQDSENCQIEAKRTLLTVPRVRLPHLKPLAADHHEAEEPDEKSDGGPNKHQPLAAIEPGPFG